MNIETKKENININQIVATKNEIDEIEGNYIVPDIKPDVIEILKTTGIISINKKEILDGKMRIDGSILTYVMYIGGNNTKREVRSINYSLDFSQIIYIKEATADMNENTTINLNSIKCKIINERKLSIKASVNFNISIFKNASISNVCDVLNVKDVQKKLEKKSICSIVGMNNTKTNVSEKINLEGTSKLAEILSASATISNIESKVSYNKVLEKANLNFKMIYMSQDKKIVTIRKNYPIMGFIDMKDIKETDIINPNFEINNILIKPNGTEENSISLEAYINISAIAFENKDITIINDMFCPQINLGLKKNNVKTSKNTIDFIGTYSFQKKINVNISDKSVVYDISCNLENIQYKILETTSIQINAEANFEILILNENKNLELKNAKIPFVYNLTANDIRKDTKINIRYNLINENYNILTNGEIEFKMDINFKASINNITDINFVENIFEDKNDSNLKNNQYNIIVYYTKDNDTMWDICKRFRCTKESLMNSNNLKNENIEKGMQLFITR